MCSVTRILWSTHNVRILNYKVVNVGLHMSTSHIPFNVSFSLMFLSHFFGDMTRLLLGNSRFLNLFVTHLPQLQFSLIKIAETSSTMCAGVSEPS